MRILNRSKLCTQDVLGLLMEFEGAFLRYPSYEWHPVKSWEVGEGCRSWKQVHLGSSSGLAWSLSSSPWLYVDPTGKQEWEALTLLLAKVLMSCAWKVPDSALHSMLLIVRTSSPFLGIRKKILTYFNGSVAHKIFSSALGLKTMSYFLHRSPKPLSCYLCKPLSILKVITSRHWVELLCVGVGSISSHIRWVIKLYCRIF